MAGARVREYEEIIGYHLEQAHRTWAELGPAVPAGLAARAVARLAAVGRRALDRGDMTAASSLLERAAALAPGDSQLLDDLVESLVGAGEFERARAVLAHADEAAKGDDGLRAYAVISRLHLRIETEPELDLGELRAQAAVATRALERRGDDQGLARAWRLAGYERLVSCQIGAAEAAMAKAIEYAERAGNGRVLAYGRGVLAAAAFWGPIPVPDGIARCEGLLASAGDNPYVGTSALHVLGALEAMRGDLERARSLVAEGAAVIERLGANRLAAIAGQFAASVELLAGDLLAAEKLLLAGNELLERVRDTGARSNVTADLAMVAAVQGRAEAALDWAATSERLAPAQDLYVHVRRRAAMARALTATDRPRAEALAREAVAIAAGTDMINLHADALVELAGTLDGAAAGEALGAALALYEAKGNLVGAAGARGLLDAGGAD
jgi:hypothetical protein